MSEQALRGPSGISADCEVLTRAGWRQGVDLRDGHEVMAFSANTESYGFERVASHGVRRYQGPMVHLEGPSLDVLVAPGHPVLLRVLAQSAGQVVGANPWRYRDAGSLPRSFTMPRVGPLPGPGLPSLSNETLQLAGWLISSGTYHTRGAAPLLQFSRTRGTERGRSLLARTERCLRHFEGVSRYERQGRTEVSYYLGRRWSDELLGLLGGDLHRVPRLLLETASARQLAILYESILDGSGTTKGGRWVTFYAGGREAYADDFQELATRLGVPTSKSYVPLLRSWTVSLSGANRRIHRVKQRRNPAQAVPYEGKVWDVWVHSGALVVRRRGRLGVLGGCLGHRETLDLVLAGKRAAKPPLRRPSRSRAPAEGPAGALGVGRPRLRRPGTGTR